MKRGKPIPQYTYRRSSKAEEKVIYRRIALVCLATIIILVVIYFWGLSFINILGFLGGSSTKSSGTSSNSSYTIPLQKPTLNPIQSPTNTAKIDISGNATQNSTLTLTLNGVVSPDKQIADKSGSFKFSAVSLKTGINQILITATDSTGAKETTNANIVLDTTAPNLSVSAPGDNATFPETTKSVSVSGTTSDPDGVVYVNTIQAILDPKTGNFTFNLPVQKGVLQIEIKAFDAAGNSVTQKRTVTIGSADSTPPADGPQP